MFGEEWEPAEGELIDIRYGGKHGDWSGNGSVTANSVHYLMEVRPLSGTEPFRCECEPPSLMLSFKSPPFGVLVKMECVPSKKKARFDRNDPAISKKDAGKQQRAAYEAELQKPELRLDLLGHSEFLGIAQAPGPHSLQFAALNYSLIVRLIFYY